MSDNGADPTTTGIQYSWAPVVLGVVGPTVESGTLSTPRSTMASLVINAGQSSVEITGNLDGIGGLLEVDGSNIKVDTGNTVSATGAVTFNAIDKSNGHSLLGITSTLGGVTPGIDLNGVTLSGASVDLEAVAGTLTTTTVSVLPQDLSAGTLTVASTVGFDSPTSHAPFTTFTSGKFQVDGGNGSCTYTNTTPTSFTGITGCSGLVANGANVGNIIEDGSNKGINHGALQLIYTSSVDIHGASSITATGENVTLASSTVVIAKVDTAGGPGPGGLERLLRLLQGRHRQVQRQALRGAERRSGVGGLLQLGSFHRHNRLVGRQLL